jgi:hypothetical protein
MSTFNFLNIKIIIMKKYLFGLSAIVLAIAFSAFTKPNFATEKFRFTGDPNIEGQIEDVTKWVRVASLDCPTNVNDKVCEIIVNDLYYTNTGEEATLNVTDPAGDDLQMIIVASASQQFKVSSNPDVFQNYRHVSSGTITATQNLDVVTVP